MRRAEDLEARLGVSARTLHRDVVALRAVGLCVGGEPGVGLRLASEGELREGSRALRVDRVRAPEVLGPFPGQEGRRFEGSLASVRRDVRPPPPTAQAP